MPPATEWDVSANSTSASPRTSASDRRRLVQIRQPGSPTLAGFGDLETTLQYQLLKDGSHETAMLLG